MLIKSQYIRSVSTLVSGSFIAQLIAVACSPFITRLFTSEEMGILTLVTSGTSMFGSVLSLRYDMAIVYEDDDRNIFPLILLSLSTALFLSAIISILMFIYFYLFSKTNYPPSLAAIFTFVQCILFALINTLTSYNNRSREYVTISSANIFRSIGQNIGTIISGVFKLGATGMIAAQTFGYCLGMGRQAKTLLKQKLHITKVSILDVRRVAHKHRRQALWSSPAVLLYALSTTCINFFIEIVYGSSALGYYSLAYRMLAIPINVFAGNVSKVFAEQASREKAETGSFRRVLSRTLAFMTFGSIPVLIVLELFAPTLFSIAFGEQWRPAGLYVQILAPMYTFSFVSTSLNASTMIASMQRLDFIMQILLTLVVIFAFCITSLLSQQINEMLIYISLLSCLVYAIYIYQFWRCSR